MHEEKGPEHAAPVSIEELAARAGAIKANIVCWRTPSWVCFALGASFGLNIYLIWEVLYLLASKSPY